MTRAERRRIEREKQKSKKTVSLLNNDQAMLVERLAIDKAESKLQGLLFQLNNCMSAALIEEDFEFEHIESLQRKMMMYLEEEHTKTMELTKKYKNDKELEKMVKKIEQNLKDDIKVALGKKKTKKELLEEMIFKYPNLSKSMIINTYGKAKEELKEKDKKTTEEKEIDAAVQYVFAENKQNNVSNKANKESKVMSKANGLKVKSIVVEGKNGLYKACPEGVELQGDKLISFKDIEELEQYKKEEIDKIESLVTEFKQVFEMIK